MTTNPWLVRWRARSAPRVRLLCFPYAGGGASMYRGWSAKLPADVEVCAVQLPGRESRQGEAAYDRMPDLLAALAPVLDELRDLPLVTFGYSLGGLVSFEYARHLRAVGGPLPRHMVVAARRPPQLPHREPPIHALPHREFVAAIRRLNGTDPRLFELPELLDLVVPVLRADFGISERYVYQPGDPLPVPLTALCGTADPSVTLAEAAAWGELTSDAFNLRAVPGDHFFLRTAPERLLAEVTVALTTLRDQETTYP